MTDTGRLRAYNTAVLGWQSGKLQIKDIDLLVRGRWLTVAQGAAIKAMERLTPYIMPAEAESSEEVTQD